VDLTERVETIRLGDLVGDGRALLRRDTRRGTKDSDQQDTDHRDAARFRHGYPSWAAPYMPSITAMSNAWIEDAGAASRVRICSTGASGARNERHPRERHR